MSSEKEKYQIKSWIETDYKLSDEELEVAKEYIDKYFKENKQANQLLNSKTAAAIRNQMSVEEFKEYQMMAALYNKTSKWNGFWLGATDAIPFLTEVIDWSDSLVCEMEEKQTVKNATLSSIMENARCQNPVAYGSGYAASLAAQTAAINGLFESGEGAEIAKSAEGLERAETAETVKGLEEGLAAEGGSNSAKGLIGHDFEDYLTNEIGGNGSFTVCGRDFDGGIGNRWWEAKSGQYWDMLENNPNKLAKFKSDMGDRLRIATQNEASYEIFSNTPIPDSIKTWLTKKGIPFTEILD